MADKISKQRRSLNMAAIRSKDTKPELIVRKILCGLGIRYRLHKKKLPGRPDLYIPSRKLAVFVHGCFWHMHNDCIDGHVPKTNSEYWLDKLLRNVERDASNRLELKKEGINSVVIWSCEVNANNIESTKKTVIEKIDEYENKDKK